MPIHDTSLRDDDAVHLETRPFAPSQPWPCQSAARFVTGRTRDDLATDDIFRLALTKLVEIVGEAAKQLTSSGRRQHPDVAWDDAARMRDRLVHHYFVLEGALTTASGPS